MFVGATRRVALAEAQQTNPIGHRDSRKSLLDRKYLRDFGKWEGRLQCSAKGEERFTIV